MLKLNESGAAIPNCQPIRGDIAKRIALEVIEDLKKNFNTNAIPIGSTIKKDKNSYCGDLDIAIELDWNRHKTVISFCSGRYGLDYEHINNALHVCSFGYVYEENNEEKIAQVDLMFVDDVKWAESVYHSPNMSDGESNYKGAHRGTLLKNIICATPLEYILPSDKLEKYKVEYFNNSDYEGKYTRKIKFEYKLYFDNFYGLVLLKKSYIGKTKPIKIPKTVERIVLSKDFNKIVKVTMGEEVKDGDLISFESLWKFICSDRYKFANNIEIINDIYNHYIKDKQLNFNMEMFNNSIKFMEEYANEKGITLKKEKIEEDMDVNAMMINEGGNAIDGASPIRGDLALGIANDVAKQLVRVFKCNAAPLGSTGKKGANMTSGDVDIAIDIPWERHKEVEEFIEKLYDCQTYVSTGFRILSLGYPYEVDGVPLIAQVDLMFVRDVEYSKFVFHSPNYIENESMFKGAHRNILLRNIVSAVPLSYIIKDADKRFRDEYFIANDYDGSLDGKPKTFWKLSFDQEKGLQIIHKTNVGKKKSLAHSQTIKEDTIFITDNLNKIVKIILGDSARIEDCSSVESLWSFVCDRRKYRFWDKERIKGICERYLNNSTIKENDKMYKLLVDYMYQEMEDNGIV